MIVRPDYLRSKNVLVGVAIALGLGLLVAWSDKLREPAYARAGATNGETTASFSTGVTRPPVDPWQKYDSPERGRIETSTKVGAGPARR